MLWRDSPGGKMFLTLASRKRCIWCKTTFDEALVLPTGEPFPNNIQPNVDFLFHAEDTHGYPHEIVWQEWILKAITNQLKEVK